MVSRRPAFERRLEELASGPADSPGRRFFFRDQHLLNAFACLCSIPGPVWLLVRICGPGRPGADRITTTITSTCTLGGGGECCWGLCSTIGLSTRLGGCHVHRPQKPPRHPHTPHRQHGHDGCSGANARDAAHGGRGSRVEPPGPSHQLRLMQGMRGLRGGMPQERHVAHTGEGCPGGMKLRAGDEALPLSDCIAENRGADNVKRLVPLPCARARRSTRLRALEVRR